MTPLSVNKVKLRNQQHALCCRFAIKQTNFVLIVIAHSLQFSTVAAATANMTDSSWYEYDWRRRLIQSRKYDLTPTWQNMTGGGGLVTAAPGTMLYPHPTLKPQFPARHPLPGPIHCTLNPRGFAAAVCITDMDLAKYRQSLSGSVNCEWPWAAVVVVLNW